jgi:hypothetical protein
MTPPKAVEGFIQKSGVMKPVAPNGKTVIFEPRIVALLDVLGFRHQISKFGAENVGLRYANALSNTQSTWSDVFPPFRQGNKGPADFGSLTVFSDTLVFLSFSNSDEDVVRAYYAVWRLVQLLTAHRFPLRGAVCFDFVSSSPFTIVSDALVQANEMEHEQEWMGVTLSDAAAVRVRHAGSNMGHLQPFIERTLVDYDVPTKTGIKRCTCINWRPNFRVDTGFEAFLKDTVELVEPKLSNTLIFLKWIKDNGYRVWFNEVPVISIGKTPPPYPEDAI